MDIIVRCLSIFFSQTWCYKPYHIGSSPYYRSYMEVNQKRDINTHNHLDLHSLNTELSGRSSESCTFCKTKANSAQQLGWRSTKQQRYLDWELSWPQWRRIMVSKNTNIPDIISMQSSLADAPSGMAAKKKYFKFLFPLYSSLDNSHSSLHAYFWGKPRLLLKL